jgi:hypothetical protein
LPPAERNALIPDMSGTRKAVLTLCALGCLFAAYVLGASLGRPVFTPIVKPDPTNEPMLDIFGPNFHDAQRATKWATQKAAQYGDRAEWVVFRDMFWNNDLNMPVPELFGFNMGLKWGAVAEHVPSRK